MIALNETVEAATEIPFTLPSTNDPLVGVTGHSFALGEVQVKLPGGSWTNVALSKIREIGFGMYAARLTAGQTTTAGTVYLRATITGAQPYFGSEIISEQGGDIAGSSDGAFPFYLPNSSDPVYGSPLTGHTFASGEVKIALPDQPFVNATVGKIAEIGFGAYAYLLSAADGDTTTRGKIYLYANVTGAQRFLGWTTILGLSVAPGPDPTPPDVVPTAGGVTVFNVTSEDHVSVAISRLMWQFRSPAVD